MILPMLEEAERDSMPLSVIQVDFWNQQTKREATFAGEAWEELVCAVQKMVRTVDTVVPFKSNQVFIFTFNDKKLAKEIGKRVQGSWRTATIFQRKRTPSSKHFLTRRKLPRRTISEGLPSTLERRLILLMTD